MKHKYDTLIKKVNKAVKQNKLDLSRDEDLSIAIMNLVSIEEHLFFTGAKTNKESYFDLLQEVREMRKSLLKRIIKQYEGEQWCLSKHLLAACMRLIEVGTKELNNGNKKSAADVFSKAYNLYSLFWGINLKVVSTEKVKKIDDDQLDIHDKSKTGLFGSLGSIVKKAIDCCRE